MSCGIPLSPSVEDASTVLSYCTYRGLDDARVVREQLWQACPPVLRLRVSQHTELLQVAQLGDKLGGFGAHAVGSLSMHAHCVMQGSREIRFRKARGERCRPLGYTVKA